MNNSIYVLQLDVGYGFEDLMTSSNRHELESLKRTYVTEPDYADEAAHSICRVIARQIKVTTP